MAPVDLHHLKTLAGNRLQRVSYRLPGVPTPTHQVASVQQSCKCATPHLPDTTLAALRDVKRLSRPTSRASFRNPTIVSNPL